MDLTEILTITGQSGLFRLHGQKGNGLIVSGLDGSKKRFVSSRQHVFTPLENITVYTEVDSLPLKEIFQRIKQHENEHPVVPTDAAEAELRDWFTAVVPEHDASRVYKNDIKKIVRWYNELDQQNMVTPETPTDDEQTTDDD